MSGTSIDLVNATITEMSELLRKREVSPVELTQATLERIEKVAPQLNCFVTVTGDYAMERAKQAEQEICCRQVPWANARHHIYPQGRFGYEGHS